MALDSSQKHVLEVVREDLQYLTSEWDQDVSKQSLRMTSPILRRLLVDGELAHAWRLSGFVGQPNITFVDFEGILQGLAPAHCIKFAAAGGAEYMGGQMICPVLFSPDHRHGDDEQQPPLLDSLHRTDTLDKFSRSTCVVAKGTKIQRREIVKYVVNKLGGAHIDSKRGSDPLELKYTLLDGFTDTIQISGISAIYFELLSIGQSLVKSRDIARLLT